MRAEANGGMTTIEVLASTASVILLFALGCATAIRAETKSKGAVCAVRLRELGIALSDYAEEHNKLLPWQVPKSSGGTLEDVLAPSSVHLHYRALSNYALPWRLVCPQDERVSVASWDSLSDSNISYFVNLTV